MKLTNNLEHLDLTVTDGDSIAYEDDSLIKKSFHYFWVAILRILPIRLLTKIYNTSSKDAKSVSENATSYKALEVLYNYDIKHIFRNGIMDGIFTYIWHHLYSVRATRNRLKIVKMLLRNRISEIRMNQSKITILSLGSGSARADLEVMSEFDKDNLHFIAVDRNQSALDYSNSLAQEMNIKNIKLVNDKVTKIEQFIGEYKNNIDIVEIVGLLDYFTNEKAIELLKKVANVISENCMVIICNIKKNFEEPFTTQVVRWPMIYKEEKDLFEIIDKSGFDLNNSEMITDPLNIHMLIKTYKK